MTSACIELNASFLQVSRPQLTKTIKMQPPLVSVCIPTYNGQEFIADAIKSVLDQSYRALEIIVVDDCSTDDTANIVASFSDERIRYYENEMNLGPKGNWNRCLNLVRGKYYKLLPHDDLLMENCIQLQVEVLETDAQNELALVFGGKRVIDSRGKRLLDRYSLGKTSKRIDGRKLVKKCISSGSNIIGEPGNGMIRSDLIPQLGKYDDRYPYVIDLDFWFRTLLHGDAYYIAQASCAFRVSENAWSTRIGKKQHRDYSGLIEHYANDPRYQISGLNKQLGKLNSYIISFSRRTLYFLLRFKSSR